jgi:hypothetical protein
MSLQDPGRTTISATVERGAATRRFRQNILLFQSVTIFVNKKVSAAAADAQERDCLKHAEDSMDLLQPQYVP